MAEKIRPSSTWNLPPTPRQVRTITSLCRRFNITEALEERPKTRIEARNLIYRLREQGKESPQWRERNEGNKGQD